MRLEFEPDVITAYGLRGCSYSTDKEDIQRAVEHNKRFATGLKDEIWTDDVEPAKPAKPAPKKEEPTFDFEAKPVVEEAPVAEPAPVVEETPVVEAAAEESPVEAEPKPKRARRAKKVEEE